MDELFVVVGSRHTEDVFDVQLSGERVKKHLDNLTVQVKLTFFDSSTVTLMK